MDLAEARQLAIGDRVTVTGTVGPQYVLLDNGETKRVLDGNAVPKPYVAAVVGLRWPSLAL